MIEPAIRAPAAAENLRIVLVGTQHPGNIGAAARAMKTMGLTKLVLVAPVKVGSRAFTAAGSTIGHDVPDGALGIERAKQAEVAAWGAKKLEKYVAKKQKLEAEKKND